MERLNCSLRHFPYIIFCWTAEIFLIKFTSSMTCNLRKNRGFSYFDIAIYIQQNYENKRWRQSTLISISYVEIWNLTWLQETRTNTKNGTHFKLHHTYKIWLTLTFLNSNPCFLLLTDNHISSSRIYVILVSKRCGCTFL